MKQTSHQRSSYRPNLRAVLIAIAIAVLTTGSDSSFGQTVAKREDLSQPTNPLNQQPSNPPARQRLSALRGTVKIIVIDGGIQIIGSKEDIHTTKHAIAMISHQMGTKTIPRVSARVVLRFQLADTVAPLLTNSMEFSGYGTGLEISALHFPESLLLVGSSQAVERAKEILKTIDSHQAFPNSKKLKSTRAPNRRH